MKIVDVPNLPPRAKKALLAAGVTTLERATGLSDEDLRGIRGIGRAALETIRGGPVPAPKRELPPEDPPERLSIDEVVRRIGANTHAYLEQLAESFLLKMADQRAITPELAILAWQAALAFSQQSKLAAGVDLELHDDLVVRLHGGTYRVQTRVKAGEQRPEGARAVLLVPTTEP